jgi:hypothetical protein
MTLLYLVLTWLALSVPLSIPIGRTSDGTRRDAVPVRIDGRPHSRRDTHS